MPSYTLTVNGTRRTVNAPADMPLLWALRDILGLTGTKFGCGVGQCRACTVHFDGNATFSCQIPMAAASGHHRHHHRGSGARQHAERGAAGVDRGRRTAVRLLPAGPDHVGHGVAG